MLHTAAMNFCQRVREKFPTHFDKARVLEIGSLDINGSVRKLFNQPLSYTGVDVGEGRGVDVVCEGHKYKPTIDTLEAQRGFDVVISTECFEHDPYWLQTFENMVNNCRSRGLVIFTCAGEGRPEHGTGRANPLDNPLGRVKFGEYYRNLSESDFPRIYLDAVFSSYAFETGHQDLYFWGVKS